jgi:hypothetical protein
MNTGQRTSASHPTATALLITQDRGDPPGITLLSDAPEAFDEAADN